MSEDQTGKSRGHQGAVQDAHFKIRLVFRAIRFRRQALENSQESEKCGYQNVLDHKKLPPPKAQRVVGNGHRLRNGFRHARQGVQKKSLIQLKTKDKSLNTR